MFFAAALKTGLPVAALAGVISLHDDRKGPRPVVDHVRPIEWVTYRPVIRRNSDCPKFRAGLSADLLHSDPV